MTKKCWNFLNVKCQIVAAIENFVTFTKLLLTNLQTPYSKLFPLVILFVTLGILTPLLNIKYNFFGNTFFPSSIIEWDKLDPAIEISTSFNCFKESILKFIRATPNGIFQCPNPKGIKYFTRLWVKFSHLGDKKFRHSFQAPLINFALLA